MDKDCPLGIEFPFDEELFERPGKLRAHLTRAEKRKHNQQWTRLGGSTTTIHLKKEQEEDPEVQRWMRAERKQQALELETMRQKYEAWMKRAEDLSNENENS